MTNGEPQTVKELFYWIKGKFELIEERIDKISSRPDDMGKWIVRLTQVGIFLLQILLFYYMIRSK
jgi:hypothetical protein